MPVPDMQRKALILLIVIAVNSLKRHCRGRVKTEHLWSTEVRGDIKRQYKRRDNIYKAERFFPSITDFKLLVLP